MSEQPAQAQNSAPSVPARSIQKMEPQPRSGPAQHEQLPQPLGEGPGAIHNYFLRNLSDERNGQYQPGAYSADPAVTPDRGQPLPRQQEQRVGSDIPPQQGQQPGTGAQSQPPAEQPALYPQQPADAQGDPQQDPTQQQTGLQDDSVGLEVDGERITADDVRHLKRIANDAKHLEADYTRKTQSMSRIRNECEVLGTELTEFQLSLQRKLDLVDRVINGNLAQLQRVDVKQLNQEQYVQYQAQMQSATEGKRAFEQALAEADTEAKGHEDAARKRKSSSTLQLLKFHEPRWDNEYVFYGTLREFALKEGLMTAEQFDGENDFLRILGLISMMDRHNLPDTIKETLEETTPPERGHQVQTRDSQGRFQTNVAGTTNAVLSSQNARQDGSAHAMFMARLADERRRGVPPQPSVVR